MKLDDRLGKLIVAWRKQATAYRLARDERERSENEWEVNNLLAELLAHCASELDASLSRKAEHRAG